jgi:hypothetical protein
VSNGASTFPAQASSAYVHLDERALVLCDGRTTFLFERARLRWLDETLGILLGEGRATRQQGGHTFGGFVSGDTATLYAIAGPAVGLSLALPVDELRALHQALSS